MDLTGQLLIAMPGMGDPRFARSVVFICAHSDAGAMGLIVNKPAGDMQLSEVFSRMDIHASADAAKGPVYYGGPVETERGFVLHREAEGLGPDALLVQGGYALTATQDILVALSKGFGPVPFLFALGYSGWSTGQLEQEIADNGWLTAPVSAEVIFDVAHGEIWDAALRSIGIDPVSLSAAAGRA